MQISPIKIQSIELFQVRLPLKFTFVTAKESLSYRDTLIIKITDQHGNNGFGEIVAFNDPFYTAETLPMAKQALLTQYIPKLLGCEIQHPFAIHSMFEQKFPMTLAGLENALLDVYAKKHGKNIISMVFEEELAYEIPVGMVLGDLALAELCQKIEEYSNEQTYNCKRFKIKIKPSDGFEKLQIVTTNFPQFQFLADANRSYTLDMLTKVQELATLPLLCIEEPFAVNGIADYKHIPTDLAGSICFDESIQTMEELILAHELGVLNMINIKIGRVGGLFYTKKIIDFCRQHHIKYWIGSMLESGISKILHVQLAALHDTCMPGDLSDSKRYFVKDLIMPNIASQHGKILVPRGEGLGVSVDTKALKECTTNYYS